MGGEGVTWVGQAPFTDDAAHLCQPGRRHLLPLPGCWPSARALPAGVNITYKILYNDAVAMTGGQPVGNGPRAHSCLQIMNSLKAEGVAKLVIVTDEPQKYDGVALAQGVTVHHRDELDAHAARVPRDQGLHGHHLRPDLRHREAPPPQARQAGHARQDAWSSTRLVCEGCGDCSVQVQLPVGGAAWRPNSRASASINQSTCNKDYSCVKGFCPSFVTVEGGQLKKPKKDKKGDLSALPDIPEPAARGRCGLGHRGGRRGRHRGDHHRLAAGHGRPPGGQGRHHARRRGPGPEGRRQPGATSRSPTGPMPSTPPRSIPPRPTW